MYTNTAEEERYLTSLRTEQFSFEQLIREQGVFILYFNLFIGNIKNLYFSYY